MRVPLTYCSFANEQRCLGVLILEGALDPGSASLFAHILGLNPGGELMAIPAPDDLDVHEYLALYNHRHRLLSPEQARELSLREYESEGA